MDRGETREARALCDDTGSEAESQLMLAEILLSEGQEASARRLAAEAVRRMLSEFESDETTLGERGAELLRRVHTDLAWAFEPTPTQSPRSLT